MLAVSLGSIMSSELLICRKIDTFVPGPRETGQGWVEHVDLYLTFIHAGQKHLQAETRIHRSRQCIRPIAVEKAAAIQRQPSLERLAAVSLHSRDTGTVA